MNSKLFKLRQMNVKNVSIWELVHPEGPIKFDPMTNNRVSIDADTWDKISDDLTAKERSAVKKNFKGSKEEFDSLCKMLSCMRFTAAHNSDYSTMEKAVVTESDSENGFDCSKESMRIMDIVDYASQSESERIKKFYAYDKNFIEVFDEAVATWCDLSLSDEERREKLDDLRRSFYVVVGGNTRCSIFYLNWYLKGVRPRSKKEKIPFYVIDYGYYGYDFNGNPLCNPTTQEQLETFRYCRQLQYELSVYADNSLNGNDLMKNHIEVARGKMAKSAFVNIEKMFTEEFKPVTVNSSIYDKIKYSTKPFKAADISAEQRIKGVLFYNLFEVILNKNLNEALIEIRSSKDDFYGRFIRTLSTIIRSGTVKNDKKYTDRVFNFLGLNLSDLSVVDSTNLRLIYKEVSKGGNNQGQDMGKKLLCEIVKAIDNNEDINANASEIISRASEAWTLKNNEVVDKEKEALLTEVSSYKRTLKAHDDVFFMLLNEARENFSFSTELRNAIEEVFGNEH